jgi:hypothetical protein
VAKRKLDLLNGRLPCSHRTKATSKCLSTISGQIRKEFTLHRRPLRDRHIPRFGTRMRTKRGLKWLLNTKSGETTKRDGANLALRMDRDEYAAHLAISKGKKRCFVFLFSAR